MSSSGSPPETKKRPTFDSPEQEAIINVHRTSTFLENRNARLFREHGLTTSQYSVLRTLRDEGHPLPSSDIAERTTQVVSAVTGVLDRLEKQGLVTRTRSSQDRRVINVQLTKKARAVLKQIDKPLDQLQRRLVGHLSRADLKDLSRLLEKARGGEPQDAEK